MIKQRLIFIISVACMAQLAVITTRQLQDKGSDLNILRSVVLDATTKISGLFSDTTGTQPNKTTQSASPRSGELTPTLLLDQHVTARTPGKSGAASLQKNIVDADKNGPASRDPFVPFFSIKGDKSNDAAFPLTEYSLSDLRVTAIIGDSAGRRSALVETNDGKSFIVRAGTKIGDNGGRIETISATTIFISEPAGSAISSQATNTRELSLKTPPTPPSGSAQ